MYCICEAELCCKLDNEEVNCVQEAVERMKNRVLSANKCLEDLEHALQRAAECVVDCNKLRMLDESGAKPAGDNSSRFNVSTSSPSQINAMNDTNSMVQMSIQAFENWEKMRSEQRITLTADTEQALSQLRRAFLGDDLNALFKCEASEEPFVFGQAIHIKALQTIFCDAGRAIDAERNWQNSYPFLHLPTTDILSAARRLVFLHQKKVSIFQRGFVLCNQLLEKFECANKCCVPDGVSYQNKDKVVQCLEKAKEDYDLAVGELGEAVAREKNKVKAKREGLDPSKLMEDVILRRQEMKTAADHLWEATRELVAFEPDFPEVILHIQGNLPRELLKVWFPGFRGHCFDELVLLDTVSRHRIYRARLGSEW
jgi:hypothetical protein